MTRPFRARSRWIPLVVGPLLSLISFVLAYFLDPLNFGSSKPLAAIPAFLLAIVVLLISQNIAALRELEEASLHSDEIYNAVKNYLHVTKVGSPETAMAYVIGRLPILEEVRNTTFNLGDEVERAGEKFYETETYAKVAQQIAEGTANQLRWKDIGDARAVDRLRLIAGMAPKRAAIGTPRYQFKLIEHNEPQLSFILLGYRDGTTEVLFNWDFRNIGQDPVVLLSRDRDIVEMFAVHFEHLWRAASPDHDRIAVRSTSQK